MRRLLSTEKGQSLILALIVLGVGALLVSAFLSHVSTNLIASRIVDRLVTEQYSADAGVEDAIWELTQGTLGSELTAPGDTANYSLSESINNLIPSVSVTRDMVTVAGDDLESGLWSGGHGWLSDWHREGDANVTTAGSPHGGNRHLMLRRDTGYVKRSTNLSGQSASRLQFWAKARSFEDGEEAYCKISPDGNEWTTVKTWINGDDDNAYHFYDIDVSMHVPSDQFWVAFEASMSGGGDYLYVDDLMVMAVLQAAVVGLPNDDFESGNWSEGSGWLNDWWHEGSSRVTNRRSPYEGRYHLEMRRGNSYVDRAVDLSGQAGLHLQFWAKVRSFESGDEMYCLVSPDDAVWTTVKTWSSADSDNTYHFVDIDLSGYVPYSSEFWVAFDSGMNSNRDYFYIDGLRIVGSTAYEVVSRAGGEIVRACVLVEGGEASVLSWQLD